jgi:uncharacterized protein YpuA (DUF1002 family)
MSKMKVKSIKRVITLIVAMFIVVSSVTVSYAETTTAEGVTTVEGDTTVQEETTEMPDMLGTPKSDFEVVIIMLCGMAFFATIVVVMSAVTSRKNKYDEYGGKNNKNMF